MLDEDDITLITVPGWGNSGAEHWQTAWERSYPLARRVEQDDWLYPECEAWVDGIRRTLEQVPGRWMLAAHSLGCHAAAAWLRTLSLREQKRLQGLLLVAPPALPISEIRARASGELPEDAPLPAFAGFNAPTLRLSAPALLVASRDDLFCDMAEAEAMAQAWGCPLVDAGAHGHLGSAARLGQWRFGQDLLQELMLA
ncbi:RBBP9/YdeN family alpha/beta hydrolase [Chromobacterium aquaticum]|uniref:RBBP9/YdeN family alpha/beta hydrolase n=1 Tax=Chromobacterium aquaticum TaxID=467180 RepID=A0ABV8ZTF3_9NEIS|nr:alpha/beta hydrolase [Chromobacterium aquaticum]MCD5363343.1 alpha/beta hydrolase [Chromobacterium aquaticum]